MTTTEANVAFKPEQASPAKLQLISQIQAKTLTVGVVGMGYVGLPFMLEKAKVGLQVIGYDRNPERVALVASGKSYIEDVNGAELKQVVDQGLIKTTTSYEQLVNADAIIICVPTPLNKNLCPDLSYIESVSREISTFLRPGQLICLESTTYPGTTDEVILPILEQSGLKVGFDFFLAHSPERVDPGNARYTTNNTNKIVGGVDANSKEVAEAFYKLAIKHVLTVSSARAAEMVKVYENTYRAVNIALANEMALLCDAMNLNTWEVLDAAFTKPFGIMPFYPGPGVGGHCIPIDPHYLEWKAREYQFQTKFIALAGEINRKMPLFVLQKITRVLNKAGIALANAKVLLLGIAYKANLSDCRESPALQVYDLLKQSGCDVQYHDSYVQNFMVGATKIESVELTKKVLCDADIVVITTNHNTLDIAFVAEHSKRILDTRNATRGFTYNNVELL